MTQSKGREPIPKSVEESASGETDSAGKSTGLSVRQSGAREFPRVDAVSIKPTVCKVLAVNLQRPEPPINEPIPSVPPPMPSIDEPPPVHIPPDEEPPILPPDDDPGPVKDPPKRKH